MSVMEQQQESERVSGTVTGIVVKGADRWQVTVMPQGSQYARNLWTKDGALVNDMQMRVGQAFDFLCGISRWTNASGQPVRSLWINSVGAFGSIPDPQPQGQQQYQQQPVQQPAYQPPQGQQSQAWQTSPGQPSQGYSGPQAQPQPQFQPQPEQRPALAPQRLPEEVKEMRIMREAAMKVAAALLPYLPPEQRNLSGLQVVAEWQVRYYTGGPQEQPWQEGGQNPTDGYAGQQQASQQVPQYQDPGPQEGQYDSAAGAQRGSEDEYSYQGGFPQ